jgi:hypothetical protein
MTDTLDRLTGPSEPVLARPLASHEDLLSRLPQEPSWGFYTIATEARLLHAPAARWQEIAARSDLQELRVFNPDRDLHWRAGRGVELTASSEPGGPEPTIGGAGWLQRDRRSRLWGEHLQGDRWYEERIPDPLRYEGLTPARYAFLVYREYVQAGAVRYVRYLGVEGGD